MPTPNITNPAVEVITPIPTIPLDSSNITKPENSTLKRRL
jgi:hypothetical protein